jgi:HK97 family phage prohead protease
MDRRNERLGDLHLRAAGDGMSAITGYAAVFYREDDPGTEFQLWDGAVERIMPGAFDSYGDDDVRALFNHDSSQILGRQKAGTLLLDVNRQGLRYTIMPSDSRIFSDVHQAIRRGDVDGSSFQFRITDEEWRSEDGVEVREIKSVQLLDVGPVTFPAYGAATSEAASAESRASYENYSQRNSRQRERDQIAREVLRARTACVEINSRI